MRAAVRTTVVLALALAAAAPEPPAHAQADGIRDLLSRYDDLTKNHDDEANRERRYVLLDMFPFRSEKSVRRVLREALDEEKTVDNRVAVVHMLAGTGESRDLDLLVSELRKERLRAPVIAIGEGLSFTPTEQREEMTQAALKHLKRAKGDLEVSLLEGLGHLAHGDAFEKLLDLDDLEGDARFERNVALGRCGAQAAVEPLGAEAASVDPAMRLSAVLGLAATHTDDGWAAVRGMLTDLDARVVRAAAAELARGGRKDAAADIATALGAAPELRTREDLRQALVTLLGKDLGHDAAAWQRLAAGEPAKAGGSLPRYPEFFGIPVASDAVVVLIDTSWSMSWMNRIDRAKEGVTAFMDALPETTAFGLADISRSYEQFGEGGLTTSAASREAAFEWIEEIRTRRRVDVKSALEETLARYPTADTICLATDSHPWGSNSEEQSRETMEIFRRLNRSRQVRLHVALVMPGGRFEDRETTEAEILERRDYLTEMAEETGGEFIDVTE